MNTIAQLHYTTAAGVRIQRAEQGVSYETAISQLRVKLDSCRGVLLSSSFEYPGRYTRWDLGFVNPPLVITARSREIHIEALNRRGEILLPEVLQALHANSAIAKLTHTSADIRINLVSRAENFSEEERSRQPGVFSILRALTQHFKSDKDKYLGLYGAFGYDLAFQFESVQLKQLREQEHRDLVLYLPDEIMVSDHYMQTSKVYRYEFVCRTAASAALGADPALAENYETTGGLRRSGEAQIYVPAAVARSEKCDHLPGEYAETVRKAKQHFYRGDLFEVVPGQVFYEHCKANPSALFLRVQQLNPAPYGALMNLGEQEFLVAASPEMYVRVRGDQVETCPISGTIARGTDAISDAKQILELLNSEKDSAELSMCTDVDRNDKSRVCLPGSIEVIGRRQVELYSRLIHTVDHVQGTLMPEYDALDAFLAHTWAVTVTGAPKNSAIQFIEDTEKSPRLWYGGAIGCIGFDGNMNTGLTLRTVRIKNGQAEVRAGATLLVDSDPEAEEAETRLKASALLAAIRGEQARAPTRARQDFVHTDSATTDASQLRVLMIDHRDSFVHNLASYFRVHGVRLQTLRPTLARAALEREHFDLVILSPGPGRPDDFDLRATLDLCVQRAMPVFGVCLGLQGIVEYFGGELGILDYPMHGKASLVQHSGGVLFEDIDEQFTAGRYHSLYARKVPDCLQVTARCVVPVADTQSAATNPADALPKEGVVMAVQHRTLPIMAVQFHPESILSLQARAGHQLVHNVVQYALAVYKPASHQSETRSEPLFN